MLRKEGIGKEEATKQLEGKSVSYKNELLFKKGINYNELPSWQKRGIGVYYTSLIKEGYNPIKQEKVQTERRELYTDYHLKLGDEYADWVCGLLK